MILPALGPILGPILTAVTVASSVVGLAKSIRSENWLGAGLSLLGLGAGLSSAASLASQGAGAVRDAAIAGLGEAGVPVIGKVTGETITGHLASHAPTSALTSIGSNISADAITDYASTNMLTEPQAAYELANQSGALSMPSLGASTAGSGSSGGFSLQGIVDGIFGKGGVSFKDIKEFAGGNKELLAIGAKLYAANMQVEALEEKERRQLEEAAKARSRRGAVPVYAQGMRPTIEGGTFNGIR